MTTEKFKQCGACKKIWKSIDVFWFLKPTETLIFIQDKIKSINQQKISFDEIKFEVDSSPDLPEFLSTLSMFRFLGTDEIKMSLDIFLKYGEIPV